MNTMHLLVLGLILIVIMLLCNNRREPFEGVSNNVHLENIVNELETVLCLMDKCPHCQKFKNMSVEDIKSELGIPKHIKFTKVIHMGPSDTASQAVFEKFQVDSAPTFVIVHKGTGLSVKTYPSKDSIVAKVKEFVSTIANKK
jgi:thioredoxin-related protein